MTSWWEVKKGLVMNRRERPRHRRIRIGDRVEVRVRGAQYGKVGIVSQYLEQLHKLLVYLPHTGYFLYWPNPLKRLPADPGMLRNYLG